MKRIWLGLAVCLCASEVAAKDLPPAPADKARGCEWAGAGFVKLDGSETCVRVGGSVRADGSVTKSAGAVIQWK